MPGARYHAHVVFKGSGEPVKLQGELRLKDGGYDVQGAVECPLLNGTLSGNLTAEPGACASDLRVEYKTAGGQRHTAVWSHSYQAGASSLALNASTELSEFPAGSARLQWALRREAALWEHRLRWEREARVWKAVQRLRTLRRGPRTHLQALAAISCPERRVDYKLDLEHKVEEGNYSTRGEVLLGWGQRYVAGVQLSRAPGPNVVLNAEASTPSVRAELHGHLHQKKQLQGELEGKITLPWGRVHKLALTGTYKLEGGGGVVGLTSAQTHHVRLQLVGALRADVRGHLSLGPAGIEHALHVAAGASAYPLYAHFITYRTHDEHHLFDVVMSIGGRNLSSNVEAVMSPSENSLFIRFPFSSEIILSTKVLYTPRIGEEETDPESVHMEISWDKHKYPNNYVSFNSSVEGPISRLILDYPNQNIFGEVINKPGFLAVEMTWDKEDKNRKIQSEFLWKFDPNTGSVSAWIHTPFKGFERQNISVNYTNDGETLHLGMKGKCLNVEQMLEMSGHVHESGAVSTSLVLSGDLLPPLLASLKHVPRGTTDVSLQGPGVVAEAHVKRRASDGGITAVTASTTNDLVSLPPCRLEYAHDAARRVGSVECEGALALKFNATDDRPTAEFVASLKHFGHIGFRFNLVGNNKTAILETGLQENERFFAIGLEHYQEMTNNYSLKVDTHWKDRSLKALIKSSTSSQQMEFHGSITGDMEMSVTHIRRQLTNYPNDFLTTINLPGNIRFNHTFQGRDLMNWASQAQIHTPAREGYLMLAQSANATSFLHHAKAESTSVRERGNNGIEKRTVESRVWVVYDKYSLISIQKLEATLLPPGAENPLAFKFFSNEDRGSLKLQYPPREISLDVDSLATIDGTVVKGILSMPNAPPLKVTTRYQIREAVSANITGQWGNDTLDMQFFAFDVPGTSKIYMNTYHSSYGEILRVDGSYENPSLSLDTFDLFIKSFGKELSLNTRFKEIAGGLRVEFIADFTSSFANWRTANINVTYDQESGIQELAIFAKKGHETINFITKSDMFVKVSPLNTEYASIFLTAPRKHLSGTFDRRDLTNQVLDWEVTHDGKTAQFKGVATRRDVHSLGGGGLIHGVLKTWLTGLEHTEMLLNFTNEQNPELQVLLRKNDWMVQVNGTSKFGDKESSAQLDVLLPHTSPVKHITGALNYQKQSPNDHQVVTSVVCDGQMLQTNVSLVESDGELAAYLDTRTSMHGYGPLTARFNLAGTLATGKRVLFEVAGTEKHFNLSGQLAAPSALHVEGDISAVSTFGQRRELNAELRYDISGSLSSRRYVWLRVRLPGADADHTLSVEMDKQASRFLNATLDVSSPLAGRMRGAALYDANESGVLQANAYLYVAKAGQSDEHQVLDAKLRLRDSILSAQVVAIPLGLRALSLSANWAAREPSRYARLHFQALNYELTAGANATHDLLVSEVLVSVSESSGRPAARLHAKYDFSTEQRNVTVVVVHEEDIYTLATSLARLASEAGTKADVYLEVAKLGRMRVIGEMNTVKGSSLELFVDDSNLDFLIHAKAAAHQKQIDIFVETRFMDIRKLNFSAQLDISPEFNHAGFNLEYLFGKSYLPSIVAARVDRRETFFKINNNNLRINSLPRDLEATLSYEKLFENSINPTYELVISINRAEVFRSFTKCIFDLKKEVALNVKMNSNLGGKKWKIGLEAYCGMNFPANINLKIINQVGTAVDLSGQAVENEESGFTYETKLLTNYGKEKREFRVEYYPQLPLRMSLEMNATQENGTIRRYRSALHLDAPRVLRVELDTPLPGYERFDLHWRRDGDELLVDAHTTFPGFERVALRARATLLSKTSTSAKLEVERDGSSLAGVYLFLDRTEDLGTATCELELTGSGASRWGINVAYDVRGANKTAEVALMGETDSQTRRVSAFLITEGKLHAAATLYLPKQTSGVEVVYDLDRVQFTSILMNEKIADFFFRKEESETSTVAITNFHSSVLKYPISIVYNCNKTIGSSAETRARVEVYLLGKTSTADYRMAKTEKSNSRYNVELDILNTTLKAETQLMKGVLLGKIILNVAGVDLLSSTIKSNTSMIQDGSFAVKFVNGKFMSWEYDYDLRGLNKFMTTVVHYNNQTVLNSKVNLKMRRDQRIVELSADIRAPQTDLSHVVFNYTMKQRQLYKHVLLNRKSVVNEERALILEWKISSKEYSSLMGVEFVGRKKNLFLNFKRNDNEIFSFQSTLEVSTTEKLTVKDLNVILNHRDMKWLLSAKSGWSSNRLVAINLEVVTPRNELERLVFLLDMNDTLSFYLNALILKQNSSLSAECNWDNGLSSSGTLITPYLPTSHYNITINSGENSSVSLFAEHGEKSIFVEAMAIRKNEGSINLFSRFISSWTLPCALNATLQTGEESHALVTTSYGPDIIAEVRWKIFYRYTTHLSFTMEMEGTVGEKQTRISAKWTNSSVDGLLINLEWESPDTEIKMKFELESSENDERRFKTYVIMKIDEPLMTANLHGVWPTSANIYVKTKNGEEYTASYAIEESERILQGILNVQTPERSPFEAYFTLKTDINTMTQTAKIVAHGYSSAFSWKKADIWDLSTEVWTPSGRVLAADGSYIGEEIKLNLSWLKVENEKKFSLAMKMTEDGYFTLLTPWNLKATASWECGSQTSRGEAQVAVNEMVGSLAYVYGSSEATIDVKSSWGSILLKRTGADSKSFIASVNLPEDARNKRLFYLSLNRSSETTLQLSVEAPSGPHALEASWCEGGEGGEDSCTERFVRVALDTPRLVLNAGASVSDSSWEAHFLSQGLLAPARLKALLRRDKARIRLDLQLPDEDGANAELHAMLEGGSFQQDKRAAFNWTSRALQVALELRGGSSALLHASARARDVGSALLEAERKSGEARVLGDLQNTLGSRLGASAAATWGDHRLRAEAKAGEWSASFEVGTRPALLQVRCGAASLLVTNNLAHLVTQDGSNHSLEWNLDLNNNRVKAYVQVDSPFILSERALLSLDFGPTSDKEGVGANVALESGVHRHSVHLEFRRRQLLNLIALVAADGNEILRLNSSLGVKMDDVQALMNLTLWDVENTLQISHRLAFPVDSFISVRSPLLLTSERVNAHLLADGNSLFAGVGRGDDDNESIVSLFGKLRPDEAVLRFRCDASLAVAVRSFTLMGSLHDKDLGFDAHVLLALADGNGVNAGASGALSDGELRANGTFQSRSISGDKTYESGILIPLALSENTTLAAWLHVPGEDYDFLLNVQNIDSHKSVDMSAVGPNFNSTAAARVNPLPDFSIRAGVFSTFSGFQKFLLYVNVPKENSDIRMHAVEWGDHRIELSHLFTLQDSNAVVHIQLSTPFLGHERYGMKVVYVNSERKLAIARVSYPGLDRDVGLELEYLVKGMLDATLRASFHAPFLPRLQSAAIELTHLLAATPNEIAYLLKLHGEVNGREATANLNIQAEVESPAASIEFTAIRDGSHVLQLNASAKFQEQIPFQVYKVEMKSQLPSLRQLKFILSLGPHGIYHIAEHNDNRYLDCIFTKEPSRFKITCLNPIKPITIEVNSKWMYEIDLGVVVGWEVDGELKPRVGLGVRHAYLQNEDRVLWSVRALAAGKELKVEGAWEESKWLWERSMGILWCEQKLNYWVGVSRREDGSWERVMSARVGERKLEARVRGAKDRHGVELLWDAARDRSKMLGYAMSVSPLDGLELRIMHPLLGNGVKLALNGHLLVEGGRLKAGAALTFALHSEPGTDWRASALLEVAPNHAALSDGGRAYVMLRLEDKIAGRDASAELDATLGDALTVSHGGASATPRAAALSLNVTFVAGHGEPRRTLLSEARVAPRFVLLRARTPEAEVAVRARIWALGAELLLRADDTDAVRMEVALEPDARSLSAELALGAGLRYRARAYAPQRRLVSAVVWREAAGAGRTTAAWAKARLRSPRLLDVSAFWQPYEAADVRRLLEQEVERVPRAAHAAADAHTRLWRERWDAKVPWPARAIWEQFVRQETSAFAADIVAVASQVQSEYSEAKALVMATVQMSVNDTDTIANAFWKEAVKCLQSVADATLSWTLAVTDAFKESLTVVAEALATDSVLTAIGETLAEFREQTLVARAAVLERTIALLEAAGYALESTGKMAILTIEQAVNLVIRPLTNHMWTAMDAVSHAFFELDARFTDLVHEISTSFMEVEELEYLVNVVFQIVNWFNGQFKEYLNTFTEDIVQIVDLILTDLENSVLLLWEKVQQVAPNLTPTLHEAYQQATWAWERYGSAAAALLVQRRDFLELGQKSQIILQPEMGVIMITQVLPVEWDGFDRAPRFDQLRHITSFNDDDKDDEAVDTVYKLIDSVSELAAQSPRELLAQGLARALPTFSATAQLVGNSHVVTFDGNSFPIEPQCSYLLAGDLDQDKFAIVVHFAGQNLTSRTFSILTMDYNIVVGSDYVIRMDGQIVDLPAMPSPYLKLKRSEDAVEVSTLGFTFRCHVRRHVCSVHVSGWHFGHVAGLLGSFDHERAGDLLAPGARGERVKDDDVKSGFKAWRVGRCRASNRLPLALPKPRTPDAPACNKMFEDRSSVLSACHARVDPAPYASICTALGPCDAAFAYSEACRLQTWIKPKVPPECESCQSPRGEWVTSGATSSASGGPQADVVLVVQRGCGYARDGLQRVTDAASHLSVALAARGIADVRFAVLSFGGASADAEAGSHLHTSGGRVWSEDPRAVQKTLYKLQGPLPDRSLTESASTSAGEAEAAVAAGAVLRARAGAGHAVVLLQCSACARDAFAQLAAPLAAAGGGTGTALHVLRPRALAGATTSAAASSAKAARAFGVDARGLAFSAQRAQRHATQGMNAEKIIAQAVVAKDACTAVALESGGSVFDTSRIGGPGSGAKRFLETWAEYVARSVRPAPCTRYICAPAGLALCCGHNLSGQSSEEADHEFMQFLQ